MKKLPPRDEILDFKRPSHPDFMTAKELKDAKFSGYRMNSLTNNCEIWTIGDLRRTITPYDLDRNPNAIAVAMQELFLMDEAVVDKPEAIAYHQLKNNSKVKHND